MSLPSDAEARGQHSRYSVASRSMNRTTRRSILALVVGILICLRRRSPYDDDSSLTKVEVLFFDLDGTVLDWQGTVAEELRRLGQKHFPDVPKRNAHIIRPPLVTHAFTAEEVDWEGFALKWRNLYLEAMCVCSCKIISFRRRRLL